MERSTEEKIIDAAVRLVKDLGYKGATTKKIAEAAEVNEVTIFRHFGSKKGLIEAIIQKFSYMELISDALQRDIVWDLQQDLQMMARLYQEQLDNKRDIILISMKEAGIFPELDQMLAMVPLQYKELLINYFQQMEAKNKLKTTDANTAATNFFFLNFGYFLLKTRMMADGSVMPLDTFLNENIAFYIESLT